MKQLGELLKRLRQNLGLSLNDVYKTTGINNSVLSHIENGDTKNPSPTTLKKLASLYNTSVISLYLVCGYLDNDDLFDYQRCFAGTEHLSDEEKELIQKQIDIFNKK